MPESFPLYIGWRGGRSRARLRRSGKAARKFGSCVLTACSRASRLVGAVAALMDVFLNTIHSRIMPRRFSLIAFQTREDPHGAGGREKTKRPFRSKVSTSSDLISLFSLSIYSTKEEKGLRNGGLTDSLYQRDREIIAFWSALDIWTILNENFRHG